jgi:hypothetical protein
MPLNVAKCSYIRIGSKSTHSIDCKYYLNGKDSSSSLSKVASIKDLGVTVDENLNFREHIYCKINKALSILGIVKRNFKHMDRATFIQIYKAMVRSQLDYAVSVWAPHHNNLIDDIEKVQRKATKLVHECKNMKYSERLQYLKLPTLSYRRARADMIEVFKLLNGKYDSQAKISLGMSNNTKTRGNSQKLETVRAKYDRRKYFFSDRVVSVWNSLPEHVVGAESTNAFKRGIDRFWNNESFLYNYKEKISGTGARSINK